jgi:hypothetical protein
MNRLLVLLAMPILAAGGEEETPALPYVTLAGAHSRIEAADYRRITSAKELTEVWLRHVGAERQSEFYNEAGVPVVDFARCMVVAAFGGKQVNSAGIYAVSLTEEKDRVLLRFDHRGYQSGPEGDRVTPYGFFFIPRSAKPLVLEDNVQHMIGGQPVWKERARFEALSR